MKIVIAGPKSAGKSHVGRILGEVLEIPVLETDTVLEELYKKESGDQLSCREICLQLGEPAFRELEHRAVEEAAKYEWCIVCVGGSTLLNPESRRILRKNAILVLLTAEPEVLWSRISKNGIPGYLQNEKDPKQAYFKRYELNLEVTTPYADFVVDSSKITPDEVAQRVAEGIQEELSIRMSSASTFGQIIRVSTFGESHGKGVGAVLDGIRPGIPFSVEDIQKELNRRRPGQSDVVTPRNEADHIKIYSGVFEGKTTGTPICMLVENKDQDSTKYDNLKDLFRPGHADFSFWKKYAIRDHRGGGRSSGRETIGRVACGAIARKILSKRGVQITAFAQEIAGIQAQTVSYAEIEKNVVRCPDPIAAKKMQEAILAARKEKDSVGGIVQLEITGVPAGLGDPVFGKLDARLGGAMLSLGAVKGVEFGAGFAAAQMRGSQHNDPMRGMKFVTNNAGGILGGISTGEKIIVRIAVKPTSSISLKQNTCNTHGDDVEVIVEGRHDPCIVPRVIPVVESMAALVLLDLWEMQSQLRPDWNPGITD